MVNEAYAEMLGRRPEDLIDVPIESITAPADRAEDTRLRAGLFAGDFESYERTKRLIHADGSLVDVRVGIRLVLDADGAPAHLLGVIENITDQLRHDVLSMCSVDSGSISTEREPVDLVPALREAVEAADMTVPVECPAGTVVLFNPAHLQQIMVNFLTNAAKYGHGSTGIDVRTAGTRVAIAVRDEGDGVPPGLHDHLFERFTRAGNTVATGHGLGRHIVASLAEANGGSVSHHDNVPRGSVFTLVLPISA